jgi:arsenate reductase (glutaredoxin)
LIIYHNPQCGTSRNTLALIRHAGIKPHIIEYLKNPPDKITLLNLMSKMCLTPRALLRVNVEPFKTLGLENPMLTDEVIVEAMLSHPLLINRPIVVSDKGTRLCRPSEVVLELLPPLKTPFVKEDGEIVQ